MKKITGQEPVEELELLVKDNFEQVLLPMSSLVTILNRYISGTIDAAQLERIADTLELTAEYEQGREKDIANVLAELSGPAINGEITVARTKELLTELTT